MKTALRYLALIMMSPLLLVGCDPASKEAVEAPPPGVLVAQAAMQQISETVEYVGQTVMAQGE